MIFLTWYKKITFHSLINYFVLLCTHFLYPPLFLFYLCEEFKTCHRRNMAIRYNYNHNEWMFPDIGCWAHYVICINFLLDWPAEMRAMVSHLLVLSFPSFFFHFISCSLLFPRYWDQIKMWKPAIALLDIEFIESFRHLSCWLKKYAAWCWQDMVLYLSSWLLNNCHNYLFQCVFLLLIDSVCVYWLQSYEEYLEIHDKCRKQLCFSVSMQINNISLIFLCIYLDMYEAIT